MIQERGQKKWQLSMILLILLFLTLACSLPFPGSGGDDTLFPARETTREAADQSQLAQGDLRCEQVGYPCSYADASQEALERSFSLMDTAEEVFAKEGHALAVAERLQAEEDVVEMFYDERGVWYRVAGAPPMIFLHPEVFNTGDQQARLKPVEPAASKVMPLPFLPEPDGPVGENPPGEKVRKKALFVAPFAWHFGTDVYDGANPLLKERRDYQCPDCVKLVATNSNPKDQVSEDNPLAGPSVEQFQGWSSYDLIHVLAHGYQFCPGKSVSSSGRPVVSGDREAFPENTAGVIEGAEVSEGECMTFIQTGHYEMKEHLAEQPSGSTGVAWAHKPGEEIWMEVVTTDFFAAEYKNGLDDKIIVFTSCQGLKDGSLAQALMGENTAVLGWSDYVKGGRGEAVAVRLFEELIKHGLRVSAAYQKTIESSSHTDHDEDWYGAQLVLKNGEDGDPRGREVITWMHPIYRTKLKSIGHTPVEGVPGDQNPDDMLILLQIDGVDEDQSPADFTAHVKIGGQEIQTEIKPTRKISDYSYWAQTEVQLPQDSNSSPRAEMEAWVDLPEGGESRHVLKEVEFADCGWRGSYSGSRSGSLDGSLVIDSKDAAGIDVEAMQEVLGSKLPQESVSGMSDLGSAASGPRVFHLGGEGGMPLVVVGDIDAGALVLEATLAYVGDSIQYNLSKDDGTLLKGTMSGVMRGGTLAGEKRL
ncbi:MAG: hypothetical protein U5K99_01095 [Anaerolineales bacterium]|nr:hypothetical protein [Anaerolineales bacterium]